MTTPNDLTPSNLTPSQDLHSSVSDLQLDDKDVRISEYLE